MRRLIGLSLSLVLFAALAFAAPVSAGATTVKEPLSGPSFVSCSSDGPGEWIDYEGVIHRAINVHADGSGGFHVMVKSSLSNFSAVGQDTGDTYRFKSNSSQVNNFTVSGKETTTVVQKQIIHSTGKDRVAETVVITTNYKVNANGDVTVDNFEFAIECA